MSDDELIEAMTKAMQFTFVSGKPSWHTAMHAVLDVLHKAGYRRCAEGQGTTQWCERANKAEGEVGGTGSGFIPTHDAKPVGGPTPRLIDSKS